MALDRIELEIWWMSGTQRRTFTLDSFRPRVLQAGRLRPGGGANEAKPHHAQAGVTLIEVLVAITLLSMLSVGMMVAMQIGLASFAKTDRRLMDNRRVSGAQRLVEQELEGMMPVVAPCGALRA